jgi:hypothetical protein
MSIQYTIYKIKEVLTRGIPTFFKNIWKFRKELYSHDWWDYTFTLEIFYRSLVIMEEGMSKKGMEVAETRNVKLKQIRRAIELLKHKLDSDYVERVEAELGPICYTNFFDDKNWKKLEGGNYELIDTDTPEEKKHGRKVFKRAHKLEQEEWKELWTIIKGNKFTTWEKFDGTDLRNWWD